MDSSIERLCQSLIVSINSEQNSEATAIVSQVLEEQRRLHYTTFAHAGLISQPPAPQQAQMLNSSLFRFSLERAADAQPSVESKSKASQQDASGKTENRSDAGGDGTQLPSFPDGFQMPEGMPEMPPDWRPGDPIPIPGVKVALAAIQTPVPAPVLKEGPAPSQPSNMQPSATSGLAFDFLLNPEYEVVQSATSSEDEEDDEWD
ncbi:hypothetical protein CEUSTIGMA_g4008.t1 [Chlamydomonas eustigma]|uniref:Mediator of RNA polymerase II transcription subunit 4 n=1 Tax=Chlamydomonas eustigma TaxID=1157962 RepID=A0A250X0Z9_9CHLO|nr:hypothetical protein CEUSTIGMA_g4008.t1 [Chlamydomonas eustigma]|eukprot:GAX76562.1 hypothetical protein CEUSTIGMA_g4008.t1 [Chlamydomonas eustigma]